MDWPKLDSTVSVCVFQDFGCVQDCVCVCVGCCVGCFQLCVLCVVCVLCLQDFWWVSSRFLGVFKIFGGCLQDFGASPLDPPPPLRRTIFLSPAGNFTLSSLSGGSSRWILVVFLKAGRSIVRVWSSRVVVWSPGGPEAAGVSHHNQRAQTIESDISPVQVGWWWIRATWWNQANKIPKTNKKETTIERCNPLDSEIPEWLQEFKENLVDDEIPLQGDSHASSSHEASLEPILKRREDLSKHCVDTHFPKDRNCEICQRTKITRAPCTRRIGGAVPRAENFGDLITADHKVLSESCESRNNHRYAIVVQDLATQWIQSYPCKT